MINSSGLLGRTHIDPEIRAALRAGKPLVALESTPFAFGWSRDRALTVLASSLNAIRDRNAMPAVFWVEDGEVRVSSDYEALARLAGGQGVARVSRATLASTLASGAMGATTISATMIMAHAVGIQVLSVGGIGGVHLGAFGPNPTLDVSPDIDELARTPMIVVSSGPKTILDVAATLEMLETRGVPVVTIGSRYLPGYFVQFTEHESPISVDDIPEAGRLASLHLSIQAGSAMLLCIPISARAAIPAESVGPILARAQESISQEGMRGGKVTRTLLRALADATDGKTEDALEAMTVENAIIASAIAARINAR